MEDHAQWQIVVTTCVVVKKYVISLKITSKLSIQRRGIAQKFISERGKSAVIMAGTSAKYQRMLATAIKELDMALYHTL